MSISSVSSVSTAAVAQPAQHAHRSHAKGSTGGAGASAASLSAAQATAGESLQQLADQGDPIAIAELKAEQPSQQGAGSPHAAEQGAAERTGASEPGKGEHVDTYA